MEVGALNPDRDRCLISGPAWFAFSRHSMWADDKWWKKQTCDSDMPNEVE